MFKHNLNDSIPILKKNVSIYFEKYYTRSYEKLEIQADFTFHNRNYYALKIIYHLMLENRQNIRKFKSYSFRKILQILRREENTRYFIIFDSYFFDFTENLSYCVLLRSHSVVIS